MKEKPDCTGQRFGRLVVLGKGSKCTDKRAYRQLWRLQCDCANDLELPRARFDKKVRPSKSCGCLKKAGFDNNRRPKDITRKRFGSLIAVKLTGKKVCSKPTWLLQCDCGGYRELSLSHISALMNSNLRLNCGDKTKHPDKSLHYPPTPTPYPKEAGELLIKYLRLTELYYNQIDSEIEDDKRDSLLRAAWIITYRRNAGEIISEEYESGIVKKYLRYSFLRVHYQRKLEKYGKLLYNKSSNRKETGSTMTNLTSNNYPVLETQGNTIRATKKLKFRRH